MTFTTDAALKLQAVADLLAETFQLGTEDVPGLSVYAYDPVGQEIVSPSICVGECSGLGTALEQAGRQLGKDDHPETWMVRLYMYLDDPETDWALARKITGLVIEAMNRDWQLDGEVRESRITSWKLEPAFTDATQSRRLLIGEYTVQLLYLTTYQEA